jgi:hypothetical protein
VRRRKNHIYHHRKRSAHRREILLSLAISK